MLNLFLKIKCTQAEYSLYSEKCKRFGWTYCKINFVKRSGGNCSNNSGSGKGTRFMWNGGLLLIWNYMIDFLLRKSGMWITTTIQSYIWTCLFDPNFCNECQVSCTSINTTVSKVLSNYGSADAAGAAEFYLMFDNFFDIINVRSTTASLHELKPLNVPF